MERKQGQKALDVKVKAEENVRARSLAQFIKDNPGLKGLRISMKGYADQEWMENIPIIAIGTYFEKCYVKNCRTYSKRIAARLIVYTRKYHTSYYILYIIDKEIRR